ncbi:conserved fungal protein [Schizosaccharomyces pombe]|uniref:Uncharacterized protein C222.17 n=1 Tax=Schizosaccharomyces pombe (strain 972 / ATCC 24843) TaxID=284812 RepID=YFMQ_SCHPO|nr:uncharacterized protein SPAC222.17 [Schizosaccharomyces pombe]C6Y4B9.1 RecName: Full=Uncharacterized protein C222.17 [Schizosaccharomyces pombe 972h-]CBA11492.1 conserved fungal protein [Schizosaccharomyces pombe]|eukprot:NP_001343067.1 uncharacterized protein SPAC222.17 [Schizosaccharomyces pombe]
MEEKVQEFLKDSTKEQKVFFESLNNQTERVCQQTESGDISCIELAAAETKLFATMQSLGFICTLSADPNRPTVFECKRELDTNERKERL